MPKTPPKPDIKKKWSFIETSKNIINQEKQLPAGTNNNNQNISQADNLSEGDPDSTEALESHSPSP